MPTQAKQQSISGFQPYVESKGEEYMGKPMREHFSKILKQWKQDLMQEVDRTVDHMKDEAANFPDPADRASQEEEFALELRARDRERKLSQNRSPADMAGVREGLAASPDVRDQTLGHLIPQGVAQ